MDAQSALRRRIRKLGNHAGGSEFPKRIRSATPEQRLAVICWLTFNSSRVKDLTIELGRTPLGMFEVGEMIVYIRGIVRSAWGVFPAPDSAAWQVVVAKHQEDGCTCLDETSWIKRQVRSGFDMLSWLDSKPPALEVIETFPCKYYLSRFVGPDTLLESPIS